jgi:hypothetical protein
MTEPTSAYAAKLDAGFAAAATASIESISLPLSGLHFGEKLSHAQRDGARLRENISCPPLAA